MICNCFHTGLYYFGGYSGEDTPVPIPNTEVKLSCADGTAWATVWESRELPGYNTENPSRHGGVFCFTTQLALCYVALSVVKNNVAGS